MRIINITNGLLLSDVASSLGMSTASIFYHYRHNNGNLREGSTSLTTAENSVIVLSIDSVIIFLGWLHAHGRKVDFTKLVALEEELKQYE